MRFNFKERLKFFGLSYFSDKIARKAPQFGFGTLCLGLLFAFMFFFCGYLAADSVPFSCHYENAGQYKEFLNSAFSDDGLSVTVSDKKANAENLINTYTNGDDKVTYVKNGYNLIVDTRPSDMLIEFTQTAVKGETEISYESYLLLTEAEKSGYKIKNNYTDKKLTITAELIKKYTDCLDGISADNAKLKAELDKLKVERENYTEEKYGTELYYLYVNYYYDSVSSVLHGAKAPVLRDYYYANFIVNGNAYYFYLFDAMCAGSFKTDSGVPVVFGGYFNKCADGKVTDIGGLIKDAFYSTVGYLTTSYFMGAMAQLPYLILIPIIIALLLWGIGKCVRNGWEKSFSGCFKIVSAFMWVSGLLTALITFVFSFFVSARLMYAYMPLTFALLLLVRTVIYCITTVITNKKSLESEKQNNIKDIFGGEL